MILFIDKNYELYGEDEFLQFDAMSIEELQIRPLL